MPKKTNTEANDGVANAEEKPARRARSTSSRKKSAAKAAKPRKTKTAATAIADPTDDEIRIRAYFVAERRHRLSLGGDADSDWLEAKRQLLSELGPR